MHGAEREFVAGADGPVLGVLEHLAHRIDGEDAVGVGDERGDLARLVGVFLVFLGVQETFFLEDGMQLAERFENSGLAVKLHVRRLGEQAGEHQVVRGAAAHADIAVADAQYLVVRGVLRGMQACVAEGGQGVRRDGDISVLFDSDDGGHVKFSLLVSTRFYH